MRYRPHNKIKQIPQSSPMTSGSSNIFPFRVVVSICKCVIMKCYSSIMLHFTFHSDLSIRPCLNWHISIETVKHTQVRLFVLNLYWLVSCFALCGWALFCHGFWVWQAEGEYQTLSAASKRACVFVQHQLHSPSIFLSPQNTIHAVHSFLLWWLALCSMWQIHGHNSQQKMVLAWWKRF